MVGSIVISLLDVIAILKQRSGRRSAQVLRFHLPGVVLERGSGIGHDLARGGKIIGEYSVSGLIIDLTGCTIAGAIGQQIGLFLAKVLLVVGSQQSESVSPVVGINGSAELLIQVRRRVVDRSGNILRCAC